MGKSRLIIPTIIAFCFIFNACVNNEITPPLHHLDYVALLSKQPDEEVSVLRCDKPWEKELSFPAIIPLPDKYIMYYITYDGMGTRSFCTCYAESADGINWVKPELGLVEFNGNCNNNIISKDFEGVAVEYANNIFYLLTYAEDFKTYLYKSTDGLNFSRVSSFNVPYCCDTQNQIIWDKKTRRYNLYFRSWYKSTNKDIIYNHTDSLYRAVSLLQTDSPEEVDVKMSENPLWRWGEHSGIPPALSFELPIVMRNTSNDDYDIYNPCVHMYADGTIIAYPIIYWHLPEPAQGGAAMNDGYARLGMWRSDNGQDFKPVTNDYFNMGDLYFEFAIGHVETETQIIHYYVKFNNKTHGDTSWDSSSRIIARIHLK